MARAQRRDQHVVVLGASAGGVEALTSIVGALPVDFPAAVFVVLHIAPSGLSVLPRILDRASPLPAEHATDGEPIEAGHVYVAPPDNHLLVERGSVRVTRGPTEHRCRPAIDPLFRSAAAAYGPRVVAVVLSGMLDDGTAGLRTVQDHGGVTVVQDPDDALFPGMPLSAVRFTDPDHVVAASDIPKLLVSLVTERAPARWGQAGEAMASQEDEDRAQDVLSDLTCPECRGVLRAEQEGELLRFRCRVGHAFSAESLLDGQSEELEKALWSAAVALEEQRDLCLRMADRLTDKGHRSAASRYERRAAEADRHAGVVRDVVLGLEPGRVQAAEKQAER